MNRFNFVASAPFGLEACVKREAIKLGFENIKVSNGKVEFTGDFADMAKANLNFSTAGRIWLKLGEFPAKTFEELFQGAKALPWGEWIPVDGKFTVTGKSVNSTLYSVSDCQAIVKKAIVEKLKEKYHVDWFDETGPVYMIEISLLKDTATIQLDTTGSGLHKRGYRENALDAPIRETMAAAMIDLSFWNRDRILFDPMCGSGTIPIEAAMKARHIAPGLGRKFISEGWPQVDPQIWKNARTEAYKAIDYDFMPKIYASDIDPAAIELAKENAALAGVDDCIEFKVMGIEDAELPGKYGVMIVNPPYAERLGEVSYVEELYRTLGKKVNSDPTWSAYVLTSMEYFEKLFGRKADAKRKLFNGRIKTDYYQFFGERPPKGYKA